MKYSEIPSSRNQTLFGIPSLISTREQIKSRLLLGQNLAEQVGERRDEAKDWAQGVGSKEICQWMVRSWSLGDPSRKRLQGLGTKKGSVRIEEYNLFFMIPRFSGNVRS